MSKREQVQRINCLEMITTFIINNKKKLSIFLTIFVYDILIKENNDLLYFEELSLRALN